MEDEDTETFTGTQRVDLDDPRNHMSVTDESSAEWLHTLYLDREGIFLPENRDLLGLGAGIARAEIALGACLDSQRVTLVDKREIYSESSQNIERIKQDFLSYLNDKNGRRYGFITFFGGEPLLENMELNDLLKECSKKIDNDGIIVISPIPYEWSYFDFKDIRDNGYKDISNFGIGSMTLILQKVHNSPPLYPNLSEVSNSGR